MIQQWQANTSPSEWPAQVNWALGLHNNEEHIGPFFHFIIGGGAVALLYPVLFNVIDFEATTNHLQRPLQTRQKRVGSMNRKVSYGLSIFDLPLSY